MKKVVLNENLNGFKYTIYGFTKEEYSKVLEQFCDGECSDIIFDKVTIDKRSIISKGSIPDRYPFRNKNIIPTIKFREIGSDRKANRFITSYFCYTLNKFGDPTLIQHEDLESAWKCMINNRLYRCVKLLLTKEKIQTYVIDEDAYVSEEVIGY